MDMHIYLKMYQDNGNVYEKKYNHYCTFIYLCDCVIYIIICFKKYKLTYKGKLINTIARKKFN